jgi:general secretion pathway protein D
MKSRDSLRPLVTLFVIACLLGAPITALAKKGEKNYKRGLQYEANQQWEQAVQEFALAVAANPSDIEYQLHYRRTLFNASQVYMQKGRALAERRDYAAAYNAFRQAYGYDQANQLALSEMDRMLRLQREKEGLPPLEEKGGDKDGSGTTTAAKIAPASYQTGGTSARAGQGTAPPPVRAEQLRNIIINGEIKSVIRNLADQLGINVIFDKTSFAAPRNIEVNLHDVTTAQALDYIFLQENLFFQRIDRRAIFVADQNKRTQYQQLAVRTFYLSNANLDEASTLIKQALPPGQGRPSTIAISKSTNSLTVRDTPENLRLIAELLKSIDKERAEVVMDVNIYEVSQADLLELGNQFGTDSTLRALGGASGLSILGGSAQVAQETIAKGIPTAVGAAFTLPASALTALQSKRRGRLLASTQVHAFDGEESEARIGQRVPVQTAQVYPFYGGQTQTTPQQGNINPGVGFGGGFPVFNYEPTGLTFKFTPLVFPNQDVQVKMKIESKDVVNPESATPTFTERTVTGTARVQNNRTMMLASVAQDSQSNSRVGLPLLGLVPVLGRLFTTPKRSDNRTDIVITVTPRVLRAPSITPNDELIRPSGTPLSPTNESLAYMIEEVEREEQIAAAREIPTKVNVQIPDAEPPAYVPTPTVLTGNTAGATTETAQAAQPTPTPARAMTAAVNATTTAFLPPANTSAPLGAMDQPRPAVITDAKAPATTAAQPSSAAALRLIPGYAEMPVGGKKRIEIALKTDAPLKLAYATLRFDPRIVAVRGVMPGDAKNRVMHATDASGSLTITVTPAAEASPLTTSAALIVVEIEALAAGESNVGFDSMLVAADGHSLKTQTEGARVIVK